MLPVDFLGAEPPVDFRGGLMVDIVWDGYGQWTWDEVGLGFSCNDAFVSLELG